MRVSAKSLTFFRRKNVTIVLDPLSPNWIAVNREGETVLRQLLSGLSRDETAISFCRQQKLGLREGLPVIEEFISEITPFLDGRNRLKNSSSYRGRSAYLKPTALKEFWIHINNRCNYTCCHCLVSSDPARDDGLPTGVLKDVIAETRDLGCEVFYFTGGEPLLRPDLPELLGVILADPETRAVVLTNGSLITPAFLKEIAHLPKDRLFFQVSLDGSTPELNDRIRYPGSFTRTRAGIKRLVKASFPVTIATVVLKENLSDLPSLVDLIRGLGIASLHLMWQHLREKGKTFARPKRSELIKNVLEAIGYARERGLKIDNFENFLRIANGDPGIKYDLSHAGWDSLALYTDGAIYPSSALVGLEEFRVGTIEKGSLNNTWIRSRVSQRIRNESVRYLNLIGTDPLVFLHGGGDPEHAYLSSLHRGGKRKDPYLPLYRALILQAMDVVAEEKIAAFGIRKNIPFVYHFMGDDGLGCPIESGVENSGPFPIDLVHSNCVLIPDVIAYSRRLVRNYYGDAADQVKTEICSPIDFDRRFLEHIPPAVLDRSYGCGSPVFAAGVSPGEVVVDLGSGGGIECFIAAKMVGAAGRVIGIDMTDRMLKLSRESGISVSRSLGYDNVTFRESYLEDIDLPSDSADVVISNCVINLSPQKFKVFSEIRRILKPGGRLVVSDVVTQLELPAGIRFNPRLKGECIGGAMTEAKLLRMLFKLGFRKMEIIRSFFWREVEGFRFNSVTYRAEKPIGRDGDSHLLIPVWKISEEESSTAASSPSKTQPKKTKKAVGCMVCGEPLTYRDNSEVMTCHYCGDQFAAHGVCERGHYVCDNCHAEDHLSFLETFAIQTELEDPVELLLSLKKSHLFPLHGPEHHALVPAVFLIAYKNQGGAISLDDIREAIRRGGGIPGGVCAFWGACAAALGIGIAYGIILNTSPLSKEDRGAGQGVVSAILEEIASFNAPRCCQRESYLSLFWGCRLSEKYLPITVTTTAKVSCDQKHLNRECIGSRCLLF